MGSVPITYLFSLLSHFLFFSPLFFLLPLKGGSLSEFPESINPSPSFTFLLLPSIPLLLFYGGCGEWWEWGALSVCTSQLLYSLITLKKLFFWGRSSRGFSRWVRGPHSSFLFLLPSPHPSS